MRTWLSGRVLASQAEDREFESRRPLHMKSQRVQGFHKGILNPFFMWIEGLVILCLFHHPYVIILNELNDVSIERRVFLMAKHIQTIVKANLSATVETGGCGKCQTSCQSACKTSCTVGNQVCVK
jgi:predicted ribosomally synthesized six-cysteine peptide SCIFF